jgi:hypothetical protein
MTKEQPTYSKQVIEIADYIFKYPDKKRETVLSYFVVKCRKTRRTIERYYKKAQAYNQTRLNKQEKIKDRILHEETTKAAKSGIISRKESLEILSKIAKGSAKKVNNEIMLPSAGEQIRAIEQLAKMECWNTATEHVFIIKGKQYQRDDY